MRTTANSFLNFVNRTGSPHHTVKAVHGILQHYGFQQLHEGSKWNIKTSGKYYVIHGSTSVMAFVVGKAFNANSSGITAICAHTDSPAIKLRQNSHYEKNEYIQLDVETYGGGSWYTWLDRGLGLAGKVVLKNKSNGVTEKLIRINRPIAFIPNLAIHLKTSEEISALKISSETHLHPIIATTQSYQAEKSGEKHKVSPVLLQAISKELSCDEDDILDCDLCLMDATESRLCGIFEEFIESPRIDNLGSVWAVMEALASKEDLTEGGDICVAAAFDLEECGSRSHLGANSNFVTDWFASILDALECNDFQSRRQIFSRSVVISADMAHASNPNYPDKCPSQHIMYLNRGVGIKFNYNQSYATDTTISSIVKQIAKRNEIPVVNSATRNDIRGGSTIGPLISSMTGIRTIDIGIPQLAMHSCREMMGITDLQYYKDLCSAIFKDFRLSDSQSNYIADSRDFE